MVIEPTHWLDGIVSHAMQQPTHQAVGFYRENDKGADWLTYQALYSQSLIAAHRLREHGLQPGDRALILCNTSSDFVIAFFACLFAGVIAVPAYPPRSNRKAGRIIAIAQDCAPQAVIAAFNGNASTKNNLIENHSTESNKTNDVTHADINNSELATMLQTLGLRATYIDSASLLAPSAYTTCPIELPALSAIAFLQYTSGSTGTPKGVMVTHRNLSDNLAAVETACGVSNTSRCVSWLPLHHDMGLINGLLTPLYSGGSTLLLSSAAFFNRPALWLELLSAQRATHSAAPNFAYELCVERIDEQSIEQLDLSHARYLMNAAEPVRYETLQRFCRKFAATGLQPEAVKTCYGMAEATLVASFTPVAHQPRVLPVALDAFGQHAAATASEKEKFKPVVSCGRAIAGCELRIVDPDTLQVLPDGTVGEVVIQSPSIANGYWQRPAESRATFGIELDNHAGQFLRTGDLGFIDQGEFFFTGRCKDLIIDRGRNLYPQDIEKTVEDFWIGFRKGHGAAFMLEDSQQLVVVQEVERTYRTRITEQFSAMQLFREIREVHEIRCEQLVLVAPNQIPMTSSGKIQRRASLQTYLNNDFKVLASFSHDTVLGEFSTQSSDFPAARNRGQVATAVLTLLAHSLGIEADELTETQSTSDLGFDSLFVAYLAQTLNQSLKLTVEAVWFLESPTLSVLIDRIAVQLNESTNACFVDDSVSSHTPALSTAAISSHQTEQNDDPFALIEQLSDEEARTLFDKLS